MTIRPPRLFLIAPMAAAMAASPLDASDLSCRFDLGCFEADPCDEAALSLRVTTLPGNSAVRLGPRADAVTGTWASLPGGGVLIVARGPGSAQILTLRGENARYSLHLTEGPAVLSYHGACEAE